MFVNKESIADIMMEYTRDLVTLNIYACCDVAHAQFIIDFLFSSSRHETHEFCGVPELQDHLQKVGPLACFLILIYAWHSIYAIVMSVAKAVDLLSGSTKTV